MFASDDAMALLRFHSTQQPALRIWRQTTPTAASDAQFGALRQPFASMQLCIVRTLARVTMPSAPS
jgi:hypothetical protein